MTKIEMTNEEAIKRLKEARTTIQPYRYVNEAIDYAIKALEQPQRSKGKWIDNNEADSYYSNCSCCGYQIDTHYERGYLNYCPNCGADMVESEE